MLKVFCVTWIVCHLCISQAINVEYDDDADDFHHFSGMMKKYGGFNSFRTSNEEQQQPSPANNNINNENIFQVLGGTLTKHLCSSSIFHICLLLPKQKYRKTSNDLKKSGKGFDENLAKKQSSADGEEASTEVDDVRDFLERPGTTIPRQVKKEVQKPQKVTKSTMKRNGHGWKEGRGKRRWNDVLRVCINSMCSTYEGHKRFNCILRYCQK